MSIESFVRPGEALPREVAGARPDAIVDTPFLQERHTPYPIRGGARVVTVDVGGNVWVGADTGAYRLAPGKTRWTPMTPKSERGPVFALLADGKDVWVGAWNGLYRGRRKIDGIDAPIAALAKTPDGVVAMGPDGLWRQTGGTWSHEAPRWARSIRAVSADLDGGLWIGTGNGLYRLKDGAIRLYQDEEAILSSDVSCLAFDASGALWAGGFGGVTVYRGGERVGHFTPREGLPSIYVHAVAQGPGGAMWVGTDRGVARYDGESWSLRHSRRWLVDDDVRGIAFRADGTAWIATGAGVSAITRGSTTLADKAAYFHGVCMQRHVRAPWLVERCHLPVPGDVSRWEPEDDDNDGSYTALYMIMECFRYAATREPDARENARKAFEALRFLQTVTGTSGFVARTVIPATWSKMHDPGDRRTPQEWARIRIDDPRDKCVEQRWLPSADGQWLWKRDTSSDEITGHFYGYHFYYDLVAEGTERDVVRDLVRRVMDHIIDGGYVLKDIDGTHTRWGVWAPERLNDDPDWAADRGNNSVEILSYLKTTHHITGDEKYEREYRRLLFDCGYAENVRHAKSYAPAWRTHIDDELLLMAYPALLLYETDPALRALYRESLEHWYKSLRSEWNPLANFTYGLLTGENPQREESAGFLRDAPLDLVCWTVDNTRREDIQLVRAPIWDLLQTNRLLPASERAVVRWDKNPWMAIQGEDGHCEWCPVFWLLPYWMGRYAGFIQVGQ
ncbi:MAG: regulator [Candidatus Hydrogenedentes bacterium]|nr:regulator [Candidatus Hydrogenedentota bacterium]